MSQPPLIVADDVGARHAHVLEEHLVEVLVAADLLERPHGDAGAVHVDEQEGDALVLRRVGIGAHQQHAPVGVAREAGPHLLAVDDEVVAVEHGARLQRRQIGAGVGLGESLTPDLVGRRGSLCRWRLLLLLGAVRDQHRPAHGQAGEVDEQRRLGARHLLLEDDLLDQRRAAAAVRLRPVRRRTSRPRRAGAASALP